MKLPEFELFAHTGEKITNKDLLGKKVVLFSYPAAFTPGCTKEVCAIESGIDKIRKRGVEVYGISTDDVEKNRQFAEKYGLEYPLLCDPDHTLLEKLDMYGKKTLYGKKVVGVKRYIHFFDEEGNLVKTIKGVRTASADEQILKVLDELGW